MAAVVVILIVVLICVMMAVGIYNSLVTLRNRFRNAFAQIDVQLKRRHDLIPNLVETAKGYLKHERETLQAVTEARNVAMAAAKAASSAPGAPDVMKALASAEGALTGALGRLLAVSESYPDLKANESMNRVMEELTSTENRIAFARQAFNDAVTAYNTSREKLPSSLVAGPFGFSEASLLEIELAKGEREAPKISF
jgi:LemA protein